MKETENYDADPATAKAVATEYTLRLRLLLERVKESSAVLQYSRSGALTEGEIQGIKSDILMAAELAERGFRCDLLVETHDANGAWLAAEAILLKHEVDGMVFNCATVPGCGAQRLCAMNNLIDRKIYDGCRLTGVTRNHRHFPVPYQEMSDGCTKMEQRVYREGDPRFANASLWTGDTARMNARG